MDKKSEQESFSKIPEKMYHYGTQEVALATKKGKGQPITIGIPKEFNKYEKRLSLRPESVEILVNNGINVVVEAGAGVHANHPDQEYSEAGAKVEYDKKKVYENDIILKILPPEKEEIKNIQPYATIISTANLNSINAEYLELINDKNITSIAYEFLEDPSGELPFVRAMSEIAGSTVMLIAAEYLNTSNKGKGVILGGVTGVPPTCVVILGAGTVAEFAARAALGLGAEVKIFDNHIYKLRRIKERLGNHHIFTSTIDSAMLDNALIHADVAIGAIRSPKGSRAPVVVTEEMVSHMKSNSIIIDVSIDQGGCFETSEIMSHQNPVFRKHDVIHYCVPNIASRVACTATTAISNIFTPLLLQVAELNGVTKMMIKHPWFAKGVYTFRGSITNKVVADKYDLPCRNLNLILAASI